MKTRKAHKHYYDPILKGCDTCEPKPQHTPTPAQAELNHAIAAIAQGVINIDEGITTVEGGSRVYKGMACICLNAAFIVRAVNAHEELLVELNCLASSLVDIYDRRCTREDVIKACERVNQAIAKAEGK